MNKKNKILNLRINEAIILLKSVTVDDKVKNEIINFIDQVGKSSTKLIKEVMNVVTDNITDILNKALDDKINKVKLKIEGGNANDIECGQHNGSNNGRKDKSDC